MKKLYKILITEKFDVVHSNMDFFNAFNLLIAKLAGVGIRISHAHNAKLHLGQNKLKIFIGNKLVNISSTINIGCSMDANKYIHGVNQKNIVIFNPIDKDFFSIQKKNKINDNKKHFVTLGRMTTQKQPLFIVEIISELSKLRDDILLHYIGGGDLYDETVNYSRYLKIDKSIKFYGFRDDVIDILANKDFFLFPSKYEGLGIVLVEAQAMGLPCFISDSIPKEANVGLCTNVSLEYSAKQWALVIDKHIKDETYSNKLEEEKLDKYRMENIIREYEKIYSI